MYKSVELSDANLIFSCLIDIDIDLRTEHIRPQLNNHLHALQRRGRNNQY